MNEAIEQRAIQFGGLDDYEFICECSSSECLDRISLTLNEYESVRAGGKRFFVVPGHQDIQVELVISETPLFLVVEKDGAAGEIAQFSDPRDGDPPESVET